jgi:hypothetical protein
MNLGTIGKAERGGRDILVLTGSNDDNTLGIIRPAHISGSARQHVVLGLENMLLVDGVPDANLTLVVCRNEMRTPSELASSEDTNTWMRG